MQFVVAGHGSRGDVEPCVAVGRELLRRGHDVRMAVPPNMLGFVESAGLAAVAYGPDSREEMDPAAGFVRNLATQMQNPISVVPKSLSMSARSSREKTAVLTPLASGADVLVASFNEQGLAANIAEYYGVPLVALHHFPEQIWSSGRLFSRMTKVAEDAQRRALGLPEATGPSTPPLEIQAYDEFCLPESAGQWVEADREPALCRGAHPGVADGHRLRGSFVDCRGNTARLLRSRQHTDRVSG